MKCNYGLLGVGLWLATSTIAHAHTMPWRPGDSRQKNVGVCAKGPCTRRADFSAERPHHHHGDRVVVGSFEHTSRCRGA